VTETFIILLLIGYFIYRVAFEVPKDINKIHDEIDRVNLHLREIEIILNQIDNKLDNNNLYNKGDVNL
jgi:hypothetical protein